MEIKTTITVNQSVDKLWEIMATNFAHVAEWTSTLHASKVNTDVAEPLEGAPVGGRVCTAPGFGDIKETFTHYDERNKRFSYKADVSSMPGFVKGLANNWSFRSLGSGKTEVTMRMEMDLNAFPGQLMAPMMRMQMSKPVNITLEELKFYAETGKIHPRKLKALQKAGHQTVAA